MTDNLKLVVHPVVAESIRRARGGTLPDWLVVTGGRSASTTGINTYALPCRVCGKRTMLLDVDDRPCHPSCADAQLLGGEAT